MTFNIQAGLWSQMLLPAKKPTLARFFTTPFSRGRRENLLSFVHVLRTPKENHGALAAKSLKNRRKNSFVLVRVAAYLKLGHVPAAAGNGFWPEQ